MAQQFPAFAEEMVQAALQQGAADAVPFCLDDIVFDTRTLLKCMFGCGDWGKGLTCPSRRGNVSLEAYREMFGRYKWGILIHAHEKKLSQKVSFALEQAAFAKGYYFAMSLSDCGLCKECAGFEDPEAACRNPRRARPALHSVGIDVFATARHFGLPIQTLTGENQQQNWYSAVFVE